MKTFYYLYIILLITSTLCLTTCNIDDDPIDDQDIPESIISSKTAVIGAQGGTLVYDDGTTLVVPKGVLTTDYTVTISKIANEQIFGSVENRNCYDISGLPIGTKVDLTFPCPAGKEPENIAVFNYDPETIEGEQPAFTYDKNVGSIKITNFTLRNPPNQLIQKRRWITEWTDGFYGGAKTVILNVPFYIQAGGSCWAADATMMAKSLYNFSGIEVEISDFLREMGLGIDDGIDGWRFMKNLPWKFKKLVPGAGAVTEAYFSNFAYFKSITKKIDEGSPVLLHLSNYGHAVLAVGYKYVPGNGYKNCELIIHDSNGVFPVNAKDGTMYTSRKWDWIFLGGTTFTIYYMMYQNPGINNDVILQTIGFPTVGSDTMWLKLNQIKGTLKNSYSLKWDITEDKGYSWYGNLVGSAAKKLDTIPSNVKEIELKVPVFNSDLTSAKECMVNFKVTNMKTKKATYSKNIPVSLGTDKQPKFVEIKADTSEWLKNEGDTTAIPYKLDCQLITTSGAYLDGWNAEFLIDGQTPPKKNYLKFKFSYIAKNGLTYKYEFDWAKLKPFFTFYGQWKGNTYKYSETYINTQNQLAGYHAEIEYNSSRTKILNLSIKFTLNQLEVLVLKGGGMNVNDVAGEYAYVANGVSACNNLSQISINLTSTDHFTGFCESDSYISLKIEK